MKQSKVAIDTILNAPAGPEIERRRLLGRKRRSLVLTQEGAGHPFRQSLPPHVTADLIEEPAESLWRFTADDMRGFASVYFAAFAAMLVFIM
ncbi:hypothetical protein NAP1_02935 [Erythrobacter sp. NAP1]|uniref:hypothetical protein n=1 Tax=Erythrobacter sp. NAP1 TaxID=237727 RepID=UPI0000686B05|nr:hypothetical protein [Erythrobacter sp. NAP1]EAQ29693.1 hypothetical protein NAP1_02935 [Erythrobacter sp. NAP1]